MDALDAILRASDVVAILGRDLPVRLIDISGSGCLLESESRLAPGTTGSLRVVFDNMDYVDDIRIMRCRAGSGGGPWVQLGAEFLWTTKPSERSLRRIIGSLQGGAVKVGRFETSREM